MPFLIQVRLIAGIKNTQKSFYKYPSLQANFKYVFLGVYGLAYFAFMLYSVSFLLFDDEMWDKLKNTYLRVRVKPSDSYQLFEKIEKFFNNLPKLKETIEMDCSKCGFHHVIDVEGLESFFE